MVYGYYKRSGKPRCALKIDFMKACDTVKWSFLRTVMRVMGYPERFIALKEFYYHPKYQKIDLVNVSLADDMFLLSGANIESMSLIKKVLADFGKLSGLHPNLSKSSSYFAGVSDHQASDLSEILGILIYEHPVRYLGIPLTTKQLCTSDCRGLIKKIN
ncbi:hypothetical protein LIER_22922 [Lithospermum erythrorhizon]|uniref:Reverse transcriptase n=1 Tax=Lithospermum erythrorhizon TaxID=34254 RepID=A0AAV3QVK4_LITER